MKVLAWPLPSCGCWRECSRVDKEKGTNNSGQRGTDAGVSENKNGSRKVGGAPEIWSVRVQSQKRDGHPHGGVSALWFSPPVACS